MFSRARFDLEALFAVPRRAVVELLPEDQPLVAIVYAFLHLVISRTAKEQDLAP